MSVVTEAQAAQDRAIARSDRAAAFSLRLWRQVEPSELDDSWALVGPRIAQTVAAASVSNAAGMGRLTQSVARADGARGEVLVPEAFRGVDGSGRSLASLLFGAVTTTKEAIAAGSSLADAMVVGGSYLTVMAKTAIADVERSGSLAAATGKGYTFYVRLVNPGACSRCAVLAGSTRFTTSFQRHPGCKCSTVPLKRPDAIPDGFHASAQEHFDSLSPDEQERIYTKAGAEAIRLGADPISVVNARRGANRQQMDGAIAYGPARIQRSVIGRNRDGSPIYGYVTQEGTTRRGRFGRTQEGLGSTVSRGSGRYSRVNRPRLMPESIVGLTDDVNTRRLLLRDAGYLETQWDYSNNDWVAKRALQKQADRAAADAFYRSKGISVS